MLYYFNKNKINFEGECFMKKIVFPLLIVTIISLVGCNNSTYTNTSKITSDVSSSEISKLNASSETNALVASSDTSKLDTSSSPLLADKSFDNHDGLPPLNDELKEVYKGAYDIDYDLTFSNFTKQNNESVYIDGNQYFRVTDTRFSSCDELHNYLSHYFTEDFIKNKGFLSGTKASPLFRDYNGKLYRLSADRGSMDGLCGITFDIKSVREEKIEFTSTVYFYDSPELYSKFYTHPEDTSKFTTQVFAFIMVKENGKWLFSEFDLIA